LLEARKIAAEYGTPDSQIDSGNLYFALSKCLEHIDAQPMQEPVAWMDDYNACKCPDNETRCFSDRVFRMMQKYTAPPKREWVGLTDDELADLWYKESLDWMEFARAHEAALKEKNNGT
jgi:hypothetical protein